MKNVQKKCMSTTSNNFHKYDNSTLFEDLKRHGCNVKKIQMLEEVIDYLCFSDDVPIVNLKLLKFN